MATIVLSAAGSAIGAGFGGTMLGLSGAVIGRAVGATLGRAIDQRLLGQGSAVVETGRVERLGLTGASEGAPISEVYGRVRMGGQVIWASRFAESATRSGGGKGSPRPAVVQYSYSVSLAIALCRGEIARIGRIWADGTEIERDSVNLRVYAGGEDQLPDPLIEAVEGAGMAPAYRGIAYVVIEDLALGPFGNRVPQFSFEVIRHAAASPSGATATGAGPAAAGVGSVAPGFAAGVRALALVPGTGEYALATSRVHYNRGPGVNVVANVNTPSGQSDFTVALAALDEELPACAAVSLVLCWFGDDLRCGQCRVQPKVEQRIEDGVGMPWRSGGIGRAEAAEVPRLDGRPVYGGTPADAAVVEAIAALRAAGKTVTIYPFLLMDQLAGNGQADPWTGAADQPALPWRGRVTLSVAPGRPGSSDRGAAAEAEVAAFFGTARPGDFTVTGGAIGYHGPAEWSYRRFILHHAHLAALAGGVESFCLGSEMRGLTRIRGTGDTFPAVAQLRALAADVRAILGAGVKISYAADWSEYGHYQSPEGGLYFPLDPFWADPQVDFIGIDNYLPLSDWRDGDTHEDAHWGSIYDLDYLRANIAGGEGYDWYYPSAEARDAQRRVPIEDGAHGEPWIYRVKDLRGWWSNDHFERPGGIRAASPTPWQPRSKPIRFTELGCPAIDKGTNEPNKFVDPKSSESALPHYSRGTRDDLIQMQYLRAMFSYWGAGDNNPVSPLYGGAMVDMDHAHVWAFDTRPYPFFPNDRSLWADGANYATGHWISGRTSGQALADVVAEICGRAGVAAYDTGGLFGYVRGYHPAHAGSGRETLQPLMLGFGFDAVEREGLLRFVMRGAGRRAGATALSAGRLLSGDEGAPSLALTRAAEAETAGRVRLIYTAAEGDFEVRAAEAVLPDEAVHGVAESELPLVLTAGEARAIAERWLIEARLARETATFSLPPSALGLGAGDLVMLPGAAGPYRIDRVETRAGLHLEAVRVEPAVYTAVSVPDETRPPRAFTPPVPPYPLFLDLPLMTGEEVPHAPHLAVTATPWPGSMAVYDAAQDSGYAFNRLIERPAVIGRTLDPLERALPGIWDRGPRLRVELFGGAPESATLEAVLNGANIAAIGDGSAANWELFQFADAEIVAPGIHALSMRLRGQAGSDALMPDLWPAGSLVVLMDGAVGQIALPASLRNVARHYRVGPAARGYDDPSYVHRVEAFAGIGLRPLSPCHLRARRDAGSGDLVVGWIRRSRIDGGDWSGLDVPLGEAREAYLLRLRDAGGAIRRELQLDAPVWRYGAAERAADGLVPPYRIEVAQISDRFGAGPFTGIDING